MDQVYAEHRDRLVGYFSRRTGDPRLAEDLAHDVVVRVAGAVERLDPERPVWPYVRATAHNVLMDHRRQAARVPECEAGQELAREPVPGAGVDDTVVLRNLLDAAIGQLPERQRVAVELRCERGWGVAECAEFLGIDRRAFRQLLFRARRSLRETLGAAGARTWGIMLPVFLGVRLGARSLADRVREFVQPNVPLGEALAGVAVAATIGLTAIVALPAGGGEVESRHLVPRDQELVGQEITAGPAVAITVDQEVAVGARHTATPAAQPTADVAPPPSDSGATVIETPDAVPDSDGRVTMGEDEGGDRFVVSSELAARTGVTEVEEVGAHGDDVVLSCGGVEGEVICGSTDQ